MSNDILAEDYTTVNTNITPQKLFMDYLYLHKLIFQKNNEINNNITSKNIKFQTNIQTSFCKFKSEQKKEFINRFYLAFINDKIIKKIDFNNTNTNKFNLCTIDYPDCISNPVDTQTTITSNRISVRIAQKLLESLKKPDYNKINFYVLTNNLQENSTIINTCEFNNTTNDNLKITNANANIQLLMNNINKTDNGSLSFVINNAKPNATSPSTNANANSPSYSLIIPTNFMSKFTPTDEYCKDTELIIKGLINKEINRKLYNYIDNTQKYYLINTTNTNTTNNTNISSCKTTKNEIIFIFKENTVLSRVYYKGKTYSANPPSTITDDEKIIRLAIKNIIKEIEDYTPPPKANAYGGAKKNNKKKTKDTIVYKGKSRCVYTGPRGGKYIKYNNKYMSCKNV
jgi:hypothetical protein